MFFKGYKCFSCEAEYAADLNNYTCPKCGGNLDVTYDYHQMERETGRERMIHAGRPDIFRYAPLLPVESLRLTSPLRVGMTPLYAAERLGLSIGLRHVFLKDDGLNPSASFKDRAGALALVIAREAGSEVIAAASTGNAGSSMAYLAASVGMPCVVFVPENAPAAKITQLLVFGAQVLAVRGSYDDAYGLCRKVCEQRGWFNRNTGYNPFTREGKKTCSYEICEHLGWHTPDRIVVPTGDGNIISGIWKGMRDLLAVGLINRLPKIDCAQSIASSAISQTVWSLRRLNLQPKAIKWSDVKVNPVRAATLADSISVDEPSDGIAAVRAVIESGGEAVAVTDEEILAAIPELARMAGVFAEPAAAATWACLKKMVAEQMVSPDERVVCLITGNGLKDIANARKVAGEPTVIDPTVEAADATLELAGL